MERRNSTHVSGWIVDYSDIKNYEMLNNNNNNNGIMMSRSKIKKKKFMILFQNVAFISSTWMF